ncbi:uncharacterized serine-rich protein C215.13-like [Arachis ipaensis]|uniref:uncharacterized serine-rich protein C215.13-like n=1 Tax=Arachis ipaensis TaxID=130454 RepID=UPI0007AEF5D6|nr:uncharacterized serine-rich protein C215.13-like [Arachis ipaensis]XP_025685361.1 uncharacterized serine-rich protein C215.13-like [Arachis hypogaea]
MRPSFNQPPPPSASFHQPQSFLANSTSNQELSWYPNSGFSHHLTHDASNLISSLDYTGPDQLYIADGSVPSVISQPATTATTAAAAAATTTTTTVAATATIATTTDTTTATTTINLSSLATSDSSPKRSSSSSHSQIDSSYFQQSSHSSIVPTSGSKIQLLKLLTTIATTSTIDLSSSATSDSSPKRSSSSSHSQIDSSCPQQSSHSSIVPTSGSKIQLLKSLTTIATIYLNTHHMVTRSKSGITNPKSFLTYTSNYDLTNNMPKSVPQALNSSHWLQAMKEEYNALIKNKTWHLV